MASENILVIFSRLNSQLDKHKIPINFYIYLSKDFDSLRHDILLDKLTHYGITGTANKFMKSYLCNRKQFVQIGDTEYKMRPVTTGVPQGSIVGPFCLISLSTTLLWQARSLTLYYMLTIQLWTLPLTVLETERMKFKFL